MKQCLFCKKDFLEIRISQKYCCGKCNRIAYYYRNSDKRKSYARDYNRKIYPLISSHKKSSYKKWYLNNKEKHKEYLKNCYINSKSKWRERGFVNRHRIELLKLLPNKCANCGKEEIKIIHHTIYDFPKRTYNQHDKEEVQNYLKEYSKKLLPFCNNDCHKEFERKLRNQINANIYI